MALFVVIEFIRSYANCAIRRVGDNLIALPYFEWVMI